MTAETIRAYKVDGMSCEHCRLAISEEVGEIAGVDAVEVALEDGSLAVRGSGFTDDEIARAVADAGYRVVR
ncbi:MAG TPA: cation transporter [Solirubrobacterales bacterium]|nr:cation transporter [Solirubrobacterales bacterium]